MEIRKINIQNVNNNIFSKNDVCTIGTFDGIHCGHLKILGLLIKYSNKIDGQSTVITFEPIPKEIFIDNFKYKLTSLQEKIKILTQLGIKKIVIIKFDNNLINLPPQDFIEKLFLSQKNLVNKIYIGFNFRFGVRGKGTADFMKNFLNNMNVPVEIIPPVKINQNIVSSSIIRKKIQEADFRTVKKYLNRLYSISGKVISGNKIGRTLKFPTANLKLDNKNISFKAGVYIVYIEIDSKIYNGVMFIGQRLTISDISLVYEINIFDFYADIYNKELTVYIAQYIRGNKRFLNKILLSEQISQDVEFAKRYFSNNPDEVESLAPTLTSVSGN